MKPKLLSRVILAIAVGGLALHTAHAQQHVARRLGHPTTRFADPLQQPEDLRARLGSEKLKADVASILRQASWPGDVEDLRKAAATAEIVEWKIKVGQRMPYMSSRKDGRPIVLWDVLWAGNEPIDAYAFVFVSKGMRYRCITPKACSNFWVEGLGKDVAPPAITFAKTAPESVLICDPIEVKFAVRNSGGVPLTQVQLMDSLPDGLRATNNEAVLRLEIGTLQPGDTWDLVTNLTASAPGRFENFAKVTSAEGVNAQSSSVTMVRKPTLALDCKSPGEAFAGRPVEVCLTLRNQGDATEPRGVCLLSVPPGAAFASASEGGKFSEGSLVWEVGALPPQESKQLCGTFTLAKPGSLSFLAKATGACAEPVDSACLTRVAGIPAILLEVVDLDDPIEVGGNLTYEIRVTNQGSAVGTQIRLSCVLEDTQEFVSGTGPTTVHAESRSVAIDPLASLEPKAEVTWRVVVKALKAGDVRFAVKLTSDQIERPVEETEATQQY